VFITEYCNTTSAIASPRAAFRLRMHDLACELGIVPRRADFRAAGRRSHLAQLAALRLRGTGWAVAI
jgi:hypothetical protein